MRYNSHGQVAKNFAGAAIATWLETPQGLAQLFQQPVDPAHGDGPWQMAIRIGGSSGRGTPLPVPNGANAWASGGELWMRRFDGATPKLSGSQAWTPLDGRVGDVSRDGGYAITTDKDALGLTLWIAGIKITPTTPVTRTKPFEYPRLCGSVSAWNEFDATNTPVVVAYDIERFSYVPVNMVPDCGGAYSALVFKDTGNRYWVVYYTDSMRGVCHRTDDPSVGYQFGESQKFYDPDLILKGDQLHIGWSIDQGQFTQTSVTMTLGQGMVPLAVPVPVPDHFAPIGPPRADGTWIDDLVPYFVGEPDTFPRTGESPSGHPIHQHVIGTGNDRRIFFMKFGPQVGRDRYEEERVTDNWIHQVVDASNPIVSSISDTRWYPRRMQVGLDYVWEAPPHTLVERNRQCQIVNEWPFFRVQGIYQSWEHFHAGKDFPDCDVIVVFFDNTNGFYAKDRLIELGYKGKGIGNLQWEAHRSDLAMASGTFKPSDATLAVGDDGVPMRKHFYSKGGPAWTPLISPCVFPQSPDNPMIPMPPPVLDSLRQFSGVLSLPQGGDEVAMHTWSRKAAEFVKFKHNGQEGWEWGLKSTSSTSPISNNLARRRGGEIECWDYIEGSASPTPSLKHDGGEYFSIPSQTFHPVTAINHLDLHPPVGIPGLSLPFWGATAFDLAAAVSTGEVGYYELLRAKKLVPRVQVYATIDHPATGRYYRDINLGLEQIWRLLPKMVADGMKGQFVYLVGTAADNVSRAEAINRIRQIDSIVCSFPAAIAGRQGGNELLYPGLEQPYMSEDAFWREVESVINPNFPWSRGAGHGGQGVNIGGGSSYLVHHSDRALSPDAAGAALAEAKRISKRNIVDDEGKRIEQGGDGGQSTGDINFVVSQIANAKRHGYGLTVHVAGGRSCRLALVDAVQLQAINLVAAEVTPPVPGHPILDAPMSPEYPVGYTFWITKRLAIQAEVTAWYKRAHSGNNPADSDIAHGLWRCINECDRWKTMRVALDNTWPGGAL